jgi:hypothetical protein
LFDITRGYISIEKIAAACCRLQIVMLDLMRTMIEAGFTSTLWLYGYDRMILMGILMVYY